MVRVGQIAKKYPTTQPPTSLRGPVASPWIWRVLAWGVHAYTAIGLLAAAAIAVLIVRGEPADLRMALLLMAAATIVDATDGTLARRVRIQEALPNFDGRRLDDLIDFLTYTFLPLLLVWRAGILAPEWEQWLLLPLIASAYGFCQVEAKTDDGFFLGFPSLWNVVAFYLYVLPLGQETALAILVVLALMTFVPSRYLYPSLPGRLNQAATFLGIIWALILGWIILNLPRDADPRSHPDTTRMTLISLFYPLFYMGTSWYLTLRLWLKKSESPSRAT